MALRIGMKEATGLELNLFERAGYFVRRRAALDAPSLEDRLQTIAEDLLGPGVLCEARREIGLADLRPKHPARGASFPWASRSLWTDVVLRGTYAVAVVPGSHLPGEEQADASEPGDHRVRLTLEEGDALIFCPAVSWWPLDLQGELVRFQFMLPLPDGAG